MNLIGFQMSSKIILKRRKYSNKKLKPGMGAHTCNPASRGSRKMIMNLRPGPGKQLTNLID